MGYDSTFSGELRPNKPILKELAKRIDDACLDVRVTDELDDGPVIVMQTVRGIAKVYDVSAVSLPANDMTSISARSAADGAIGAIKKERLAALRRAEQIRKIKILTLT